jgi:beta-glucanase (GH16 family)
MEIPTTNQAAQAPQEFNRRRFLAGLGVAAGGLLLGPGLAGCESTSSRESMFDVKPDWGFDFATMPDGQPKRDDWNFEMGTGVSDNNGEAQAYTDWKDAVRIQDGKLVIEAKKTPYAGREYVSARINTLGKFDFTYGKIEVAMRLPQGAGTWPAAWLMPSKPQIDPRQYGLPANASWPLNGELDIMEAVGTQPNKVFGSVHTQNNNPGAGRSDSAATNHVDINTTDGKFHTYGIEWLPDSISFTADGEVYHTYKKPSDDPRDWPFNQPFHLILNLAMGGTWGGEAKADYPPYGINDASAPWQLAISSVHHYPLVQSAQPTTSR